MKEEQRVIEKVYTVDSGGLFSFYIPRPDLLFDRYSTLELLRCYRIFASLDPSLCILIVSSMLSNNIEFLMTKSRL